jgi:hypothetical protein
VIYQNKHGDDESGSEYEEERVVEETVVEERTDNYGEPGTYAMGSQ